MKCQHFSLCGGCSTQQPYTLQLQNKLKQTQQEFCSILSQNNISIQVFESPHEGFRARVEFRFYRNDSGELFYAMSQSQSNHRTPITQCPILIPHLQHLMPLLLDHLRLHQTLHHKLYACNLLASKQGEIIISLIYHKNLDSHWRDIALQTQSKLTQSLQAKIHIIGRSKNQKLTLSSHIIHEHIQIFANTPTQHIYHYCKQEGTFSQPNPFINTKMIEFILSALHSIYPHPKSYDALELYCGSGNFTLPLASLFRNVLATEVVKSAITLLHQNMQQNNIQNIIPARINAHESIQALRRERKFFRLKNVELDAFKFDCVLIDPPRSGVNDETILCFLQEFSTIIYISCNPITLLNDMQTLSQTHTISHFGLFDQFPHTHHRECILILKARNK